MDTDINASIKKACIIFCLHFGLTFLISIMNTVDSLMYLDLSIPDLTYISFNLFFYIFTMILNITNFCLLIWVLTCFKNIELNLTGEDKHYSRTIKYYPLVLVNYLLLEFGSFILMLVPYFFLIISLLAFIGTIYYIIYIYNLGKELESSLLKIGAVFFILGPVISFVGVFQTLFIPIFSISGLYILIGIYFLLDIVGGISSLLIGVGLYTCFEKDFGRVIPDYPQRQRDYYDMRQLEEDETQENSLNNQRSSRLPYESNSSPSKLPQRPPIVDDLNIKCPICNKMVSKDMAFCPFCGRYLQN
ncbi:MAG: zinc ribbon domain-containing protein [Candidatus Lokiarchaeota archaeon]|nr:zinc ribbon domain-containing protein [Candidatus Lokiarchaeota archaeon]